MAVKELFNPQYLENKIKATTPLVISNEQKDILFRWSKTDKQDKNETQLQADFLNEIFGGVLGYTYKRGLVDYNLEKEQKTDVDGTKPDAVLGFFTKEAKNYKVIIELKGPKANLDAKQNRKDFSGTPVEQAFSYVPSYENRIDWVIVSNFNEIRIYKSDFKGKYHSFNLKDLATHEDKQQEFLFLLSKQNLIGLNKDSKPLIKTILEESTKIVEVIQKEFYKDYKIRREDFIHNVLKNNQHLDINTAVAKVQKLFDRLLFIRFCENSSLIANPEKLIGIITWDTIKSLFKYIDEGEKPHVSKFNGGLFANDDIFNNLIINKELLQALVTFLNDYNFKNQITINILGHIFEQSISDIEELKAKLNNENHDKKQSIRKKDGIFYTPSYITEYIVQEAVGGYLEEQKTALNIYNIEEVEIPAKKSKKWKNPNQELINKYTEYGNILENIKILDPSCGSGAFLVEVFNFLQKEWINYNHKLYELGVEYLFDRVDNYKNILKNNIYGVDLNSESVQISKLSLWLKTAQKDHELTTLDNNIKVGNSLINDEKVETEYYIDTQGNKISKAFNWQKEFPEVFKNGGFDVVVGNPPYVFSRNNMKTEVKNYYKNNYKNTQFKLNTYVLFTEKAYNILNEKGILGLIIPKNWMTIGKNSDFRKFILTKTGNITIANCTNRVFEQASVDVNILISSKQVNNSLYFLNITASHKTDIIIKDKRELLQNDFIINSNDCNSNNLINKIESISILLEQITEIKNGVQCYTVGEGNPIQTKEMKDSRVYHSVIKKDDSWIPYLDKSDIKRYYLSWSGTYVKYGDNLSRKRKDDLFYNDRIVVRQIPAKLPYSIISVYLTEHFINDNNGIIIKIINKQYDLKFIHTIINSKLISYWFNEKFGKLQRTIFPQFKINELKQFPIPLISQEEQQPFITKAQDMLDFNQELNEISNKLLDLLKVDLGVSNITNKLGKWYNLQEKEFFAEIDKQNKNLSLNEKSQWIEHFKEEKRKINDLQSKINITDKEIDSMVYNLYQLSEEEIKTIEKNSN